MKIYYIDEYEELLLEKLAYPVTVVPRAGEFIDINGEEWEVVKVVWNSKNDDAIVHLKADNGMGLPKLKEDTSGRLQEVKNAIVAVGKRQDRTDKKVRAVTEQTASVRKHINKQIQQDKKDSNDTR